MIEIGCLQRNIVAHRGLAEMVRETMGLEVSIDP